MEKKFDKPLPQKDLDLDNKSRSNMFAWRGQFSPELIENLLKAYCPEGATLLDPFCGSGTVLFEAGQYGIEAVGIELNPAAYILSRTYELINLEKSEINEVADSLVVEMGKIFDEPVTMNQKNREVIDRDDFEKEIFELKNSLGKESAVLLDTFVILLDIHNKEITTENIYSTLYKLIKTVKRFPHSEKRIKALLGDSRNIPLDDNTVDFVITSPPYINVFNYHQHYRRSAELLGWELLKIARSEIGSNRANRGNRFLTVIQYCLDIASTLKELHRVTNHDSKMIFVVGHESRVLSVPFYNANIISNLAEGSGLFKLVLQQQRTFKNKFGKLIREDLLHFEKEKNKVEEKTIEAVARIVALKVLKKGLTEVPRKNVDALKYAINLVDTVQGIPIYNRNEVQYNRRYNLLTAEV